MANQREQLLNDGTQHAEQLDSVLAEFREQHITAAQDFKLAVANSKTQGSVRKDEYAVITDIAPHY